MENSAAGGAQATNSVLALLAERPRPAVCGIVNVTPDSFSDAGRFASASAAVDHGLAMVAEGADMLDVGGESTRPGATAPSLREELRRVVPVVERLARATHVPISVDTSRPEVIRASVAAGARFVNDVRALRLPGAVDAVAELGVPVCLMHMSGVPKTMQQNPFYAHDIVEVVRDFLSERRTRCIDGGVSKEDIVVDPGFGFGKTTAHNYALLAALPRIVELGSPVLVGMSRKSMIGAVIGRGVEERCTASVVAAVLAARHGAMIVRVHDVAATVDGLAVLRATEDHSAAPPILRSLVS